jgi:hypothetical protein
MRVWARSSTAEERPMPRLYIATNGLSVWYSDDLGDTLVRMQSETGLYSASQVWALARSPAATGAKWPERSRSVLAGSGWRMLVARPLADGWTIDHGDWRHRNVPDIWEKALRVLIDGVVREPLSLQQIRDIRQFRAEPSVQGAILSAEKATTLRLRDSKTVFLILWTLTVVVAAIISSLAEPADQPLVLGAAVIMEALLGVFLGSVHWRRSRSWQRELPRRLSGLAPAGSTIGVDAAGVAIAGQVFAWSTLAIDQVELAEYTSRRSTMLTLERLTLAGHFGPVVLDPAMMQNGHLIIGNAWRRLQPHDAG